MTRKHGFIPLARPFATEEEVCAVSDVLRSGWWTTGAKVTEFESEVCRYLKNDNKLYAVALNSCTAGLHLCLLALGIGPGDEVIVPTWTFAATAHVVAWLGATPVLCDVEQASLNIDCKKLESLITPRTKAVIPVHFAGYPCAMDELLRLAKKHNLKIIEDAAHAFGARFKGVKIGAFGDITVFSFYATKNLACGEGGMAVSKDKGLIERIRKLSYFGINKNAFMRYGKNGSWFYEIEELGYKYNMDSMHAALGVTQLKKLEWMNKKRRRIAKLYRQGLNSKITFFEDNPDRYHVYHLFPIQVDRKIISRDKLIVRLRERNIGTSVHFIPLHRHRFYKALVSGRSFPVADSIFEEVVSIPIFPGMSDKDAFYVIESINSILKKRG